MAADTWLDRVLAVECPEGHGFPNGPCWGGMGEHDYFCASRIQAAEEAERARKAERPAPAPGQVWNWDNVGQWRETTLLSHEDGGEHPGWMCRGLDGTIGYFRDENWDEMTFVRGPDICKGRAP